MTTRRNFFKQTLGTFTLLTGHRLMATQQAHPVFKLIPGTEEELYQYLPANNGASPMWGNGMTTVIRIGDDVYASGLETVPEIKGLSNCRWLLFRRYPSGWKLESKDLINLTREPCSLAVYDKNRVLLSVNPKQADACVEYCLTHPEILSFDRHNLHAPYQRLIPEWKTNPGFNDHSYRAFAADPKSKELILFQNYMYHHAEWTYLDREGNWSASDALKWPVETYAGKETPLRLCYSNVAIRNKKVFFFAAADVVEPVEEWKNYKLELTGAKWDYVFRRLFFTWSDDISKGIFHPWVELANRDETAGNIRNQDLWLDNQGRVHLLWVEKAIDERLRDQFFPHEKQHYALNYTVLNDGKTIIKRSLLSTKEDDTEQLIPGTARFHTAPDAKLFVAYYVSGHSSDGTKISENRLIQIYHDGTTSEPRKLPLKRPFTDFQTANERAGCTPSVWLDMIGSQEGVPNTISYANIRLDL